ncbi:MAG: cupin domain-containing protein [Flavisolibacter sp.]
MEHYQWGEGCDGWILVDERELSVKQERMPVGTAENYHYHERAQQFFFILKGKARFQVEEEVMEVNEGEGLRIEAGKKHRIINAGNEPLEFILSSQPNTGKDRINC